MDAHTSNHHRDTGEKIFSHVASPSVDLRRMLKQAGFVPGGGPSTPEQRSRDHGDGPWGEPN
jgi:hypothetical protein